MANPAAISAIITITAKDINGNSVAKTFSAVLSLEFNYFKGMLRIIDGSQGEFYFPLSQTTLTYTIAGTNVTIVTS